jgi:hypothetical protein
VINVYSIGIKMKLNAHNVLKVLFIITITKIVRKIVQEGLMLMAQAVILVLKIAVNVIIVKQNQKPFVIHMIVQTTIFMIIQSKDVCQVAIG